MPEKQARLARLFWYVFWLAQLLYIVGMWASNRWEVVKLGGGGGFIAIGALYGLIGAFALLTQVFMISGVKIIERPFGLDRLARMHHRNAAIAYVAIISHVMLIVYGHSLLSGQGFLAEYKTIINTHAYTLFASIAVLLLNIVLVTSIAIVRRRLRYEWWLTVHWMVYAVIVLSFFHQVTIGQELLGSQTFRAYWYVLYILALGAVIWRRWLLPPLFQLFYGFRVEKVEEEADGVTSVYIGGRRVEKFDYIAGQFNLWLFWQKGYWTQHHPFTISSAPGDPLLRLSAKAIGDYTAKLPKIKKGTHVLLSGPYGRFTQELKSREKRLFIAGGIGVTPIRSMLGDNVQTDDILLYAARSRGDLAFRDDFDRYKKDGLSVHYILSDEEAKGMHEGQINSLLIKELVPDVSERDVWLCGPPGMMDAVTDQLIELGVPRRQIHTERFRL